MSNARVVAAVLTTALAAVSAAGLAAQSGAATPRWDTLARAALPEGAEPILDINSLTLPAEPVPRVTQPHTHTGPVVAYIVKGMIENQIEPDPPATYRTGGFFLERPMHVHSIFRNLSTTEPATLVIAQVGRTRVPDSLVKPLRESEPAKLLESQHQWQVSFPKRANQEFRAFRLTLPPGTSADSPTHTGPGLVYVLEGAIKTSAASVPVQAYGTGDLFLDPAYRAGQAFTNTSNAPATLLLYQVNEQGK